MFVTGLLLSFKRSSRPFRVTITCCQNPECPCRDLTLHFEEIDERFDPVAGGVALAIQLDAQTWTEIDAPVRLDAAADLVREFFEDLSPELKGLLEAAYRKAKKRGAEALALERHRLSPDEVKKGSLVSYSDVVAKVRSLCFGGTAHSYRFQVGDREYLVDDMYCPNPSCRCNQAHLFFFRSEKHGRKWHLTDVAAARMRLDGSVAIERAACEDGEDAQRIVSAWRERFPSALETLEHRYREIKQLGERSLSGSGRPRTPAEERPVPAAPPKPRPKPGAPGRNDPCPCGSGKKFKKCCGGKE